MYRNAKEKHHKLICERTTLRYLSGASIKCRKKITVPLVPMVCQFLNNLSLFLQTVSHDFPGLLTSRFMHRVSRSAVLFFDITAVRKQFFFARAHMREGKRDRDEDIETGKEQRGGEGGKITMLKRDHRGADEPSNYYPRLCVRAYAHNRNFIGGAVERRSRTSGNRSEYYGGRSPNKYR